MDLLKPVFHRGKLVAKARPNIHETREYALAAAKDFIEFNGTEPYAIGLERHLFELKQDLIKTTQKSFEKNPI